MDHSFGSKIDRDHRRTLFFRFPYRVKEKNKVKELYPGIEAVRFRKRINRWCHIRFESEEIAKQARKALHNKKVENGKLIVLETKKSTINKQLPVEEKNSHVFKVLISNLPDKATVKDVKLAFPGCKKVHILPKDERRNNRKATVTFGTQKQLENITKGPRVFKVCGTQVTVSCSASATRNVSQGKRKAGAKSEHKEEVSSENENNISDENDINSDDINFDDSGNDDDGEDKDDDDDDDGKDKDDDDDEKDSFYDGNVVGADGSDDNGDDDEDINVDDTDDRGNDDD